MQQSELEAILTFQMRAAKVPKPETEVVFHPSRQWRFDFAWPDRMVAVEVEGATQVQGRHTRGGGFEEDCTKYAEAAILGWYVLRFTGAQVKDGRALALIERMLAARTEG